MMFATLDDLDGSVEIVVFEKALAAAESVIADDAIVLVRGTRRPQGGRQGLHHRRRRRQVRPVGRRDREGQGAGGEGRRGRAEARSSAAWTPRSSPASGRRRPARAVRALPGRHGVRARDAHPHGPAAPEVRRRLQGQGARRRAARPSSTLLPPAPAAGRRRQRAGLASSQPLRQAARAQVVRPRHVDRARSPCRCAPGPRRSPAGPRSAARRGTRSCPRRRSRRRRGWRGGRGWSPAPVIESLTCSAPSRSQADDLVELVDDRPPATRACARRSPRRTGGRSPGRRRAACRRPPSSISVASSSNERPSVPPAPAVSSSSSGHVSDSASASLMTAPARLSASSTEPPFLSAEPGCRTTPARLQLRAGVERHDQRGERLVANLGVLGRAVEQVDGVDDQRLDVASPPSPRGRRRPPRRCRRAPSTPAGSG